MAASDHPNPNARSVEAKDESLAFGAVLGATIGNMLEFYDFVTYSFFATQIGHTFFHAGDRAFESRGPRKSLSLGFDVGSVPAAGGRSAFRLSGQKDEDAGEHEHQAYHREGVAEAHHQRLLLD